MCSKLRKKMLYIPEFLYKNKGKIRALLVLASAIFIGWVIFYSREILLIPWEIFKRNFGELQSLNILLWFLLFVAMVYIFANLTTLAHAILRKEPNWWVFGTIITMVFLFYLGMAFIDTELGLQDVSFYLRDAENNYSLVGNLTCNKEGGIYLAGEEVHCITYPPLVNVSATLEMTLENGSVETVNFSDLSFQSQKGTSSLHFKIEGNDKEGTLRNLSISSQHHFLTLQKFQEKRERFVAFVLGLLAVILFSVPSSASNFKSLTKK